MKLTLLLMVLIGVVAGLIGALCGVGGGIVMVPAFVKILGMEQKQAVATSLAVIILITLASTANHHFSGARLIDWKVVALVGLGAVAAAWLGSDLMRSLSNPMLTKVFGVVLVLVGVQMLWKG
jgi:hypothetical protein